MPPTQHPADRSACSPETCRWRVASAGEGGERACCRLLQQFFGPSREQACLVTRDVCTACCGSFPPTFETLNPVVASLVFDRAGAFSRTETNARAVEGWRSLRQWAEQFLEIEAPALPALALDRAQQRQSAHARPLRELLPLPAARCGEPVGHWAVGVTTAPRRRSHLAECLGSLAEAGWPRPTLFLDGAARVPVEWAHLPITSRDEQIGAWPNYYLSLQEMLMREPLADAFLLVQDDALFYCRENVRDYLESMLWPGERPGIVSLYCATPDARQESGWFPYPGRWKFGAVAMIFPREIAQRLVISPLVFGHRWAEGDRGRAYIPAVLAQWAEATATPIYFPTPSLVQHVGETSAIWLGAYELSPLRRAGVCLENTVGVLPSGGLPAAPRSTLSWRDDAAAEFPETAFPCDPAREADYRNSVARGRERMASSSAVLCGLCRDVAPHLPATVARVERLAGMFRSCPVIVFENDSLDGTPDLLRQWAAANPGVHVYTERLKQPKFTGGTHRDRTERMAYYRNRCRERVLADFASCEFVLVADLDLEGGWSYDGVAHTFGQEGWDFVGSNGVSFEEPGDPEALFHVDAFAYRAVGQQAHSSEPQALRFRRGEPLVPVWSCFGGLGVYRSVCYQAADYEGSDCEHVTFHRALRERGFDRLFLNPSQIVLYSPWRTRA